MDSDSITSTMDSDAINRRFTKEYNRLQNVYATADEDDADALNACIRGAKALLEDFAIPRFHRIKTLLLLTSVVPDVHEARTYHWEAEALWRVVRAYEPKGANVLVEEGLEQIRESIEELRSALEHEEDEDEGSGDKERRQQAQRLAEQQEEEEEERVDAEVFGMTVEAAKKAKKVKLAL